jgi:hypothetical protein
MGEKITRSITQVHWILSGTSQGIEKFALFTCALQIDKGGLQVPAKQLHINF